MCLKIISPSSQSILKIENEMFENIFSVIPIGLRNDMAYLTKCARDLGITVPLFTNDGFEEGSFNPTTKEGDGRRGGRFGIDLYGFDKVREENIGLCPTLRTMNYTNQLCLSLSLSLSVRHLRTCLHDCR